MRIFGKRLGIGARHDEDDVGEGGVGDVTLGAVQDIAVAVPHRARLHRRAVGAAVGLGQPEGGDRSAGELRRSEEHTSELQSLMRISYAVFCLKKKTKNQTKYINVI